MADLEQFYVDKGTPVPLYYQLKQRILDMIGDHTLEVGDMLPAELELCEHLGISRPTVRQALSELVADGYLHRLKGKGTFVSRPKIEGRFFQKLEPFHEEMRQKGMTPSTEVLRLERTGGIARVNRALGLDEGDALIYLSRLRAADGEPVVCVETWLPCAGLEELLALDLAENSLYELLEERFGQRVCRVEREIEAVCAAPAEAALLRIEPGQALCLVRTVSFTAEGRPVEYSVARYRGDRNRFRVELWR